MKTTNKPLREAIEEIVLGAVVVAPPKFPLKDGDPLFTIQKRPAATLILKELETIPDRIMEVEVSGVAVPRNEMDKISIQDLRLVLARVLKGNGDVTK